jgi:signal transduction histidine kinase
MKTETVLAHENERLRGDLRTIGIRVGHDLKTSLGGIVSMAEMLKEILAERDPKSAGLTNSFFTCVDEVTKLIGQIHTVTKASTDPKSKQKVNMGEIVSRVLERLESRILKKQAAVIRPESWPEVEGVPDWLEFIWWNLLANALQHAGEKKRIELTWQKEKNQQRFQISDNGAGVPVEIRKKLFQPFASLHKPDSTPGLGLSIVERLVELQGGNCGYEPNPNGGSCFYFTLPAEAIKGD